MSAFIVDDSVYKDVEATLVKISGDAKGCRNMILDFRGWNYRMVDYRYHETNPVPDYDATPEGKPVSLAQLLKHLHCIDYQCSESQAYEDSKAHKAIEALCKAIEDQGINRKSAAYDAANWG